MKSLKIWSLAMILLMALVGCSKKGNNPGTTDPVGSFEGIEKEWKLVSVDGVGADFNVYIKFEMGSFAMYQQIYTLEYKFFDGDSSSARKYEAFFNVPFVKQTIRLSENDINKISSNK